MVSKLPEIPKLRETRTEKELKGTRADPEGVLIVQVYNKKRAKVRSQRMKRKTLMGKIVLYKSAVTGTQMPGVIVAFCGDTGMPYIEPKDSKHPVETTDGFMVVEG